MKTEELTIVGGLFCALALFSSPTFAQHYRLTAVGSLGGQNSGLIISEGYGINNAGAVVGLAYDSSSNQQAFFYSSSTGITQVLPRRDPVNIDSIATAINQQGTAVGWSDGPGGFNAVSWSTNPMVLPPTDLGSACVISDAIDSLANAINSNGDVAGLTLAADCNNDEHAAKFAHGIVTDLGTLGGTHSEALGINDSGVIVGYSFFDPSNSAHAFSWDGSMHDLHTFPGGLYSYAYAINASGVIVGYSDLPGVANGHAFMLPPGGAMQDLTPGSVFESHASAINSSGQIVGFMGAQKAGVEVEVPFIYSNGTISDLNTMIDSTDPLAPFVTLTGGFGFAILIPVSENDVGQIVATGTDSRTGAQQAYLLTPTTPAAIIAALSSTSLDASGNYVVSLMITNTGGSPAPSLAVASASLVVVQNGRPVTIPASALPAVQNNLAPGASAVVSLTFPATAGTPGSAAAMRWAFTYTNGSVSGTLRLALP